MAGLLDYWSVPSTQIAGSRSSSGSQDPFLLKLKPRSSHISHKPLMTCFLASLSDVSFPHAATTRAKPESKGLLVRRRLQSQRSATAAALSNSQPPGHGVPAKRVWTQTAGHPGDLMRSFLNPTRGLDTALLPNDHRRGGLEGCKGPSCPHLAARTG